MRDIRWFNNHIIDLSKSKWDKEKSNPEKAEYVFTEKVYYRPVKYDSPWKVGFFIRYVPPYRDINYMAATQETTPVKATDCLFVPEGIAPNEVGYFQLDDVILAKEPKMHFRERRRDAIEASEGARKAVGNKFLQEAEEAGTKGEVYDF